jgi:hypothetical protein
MKPHYLYYSGFWWKFSSLWGARKFLNNVKSGRAYLWELSPKLADPKVDFNQTIFLRGLKHVRI